MFISSTGYNTHRHRQKEQWWGEKSNQLTLLYPIPIKLELCLGRTNGQLSNFPHFHWNDVHVCRDRQSEPQKNHLNLCPEQWFITRQPYLNQTLFFSFSLMKGALLPFWLWLPRWHQYWPWWYMAGANREMKVYMMHAITVNIYSLKSRQRLEGCLHNS